MDKYRNKLHKEAEFALKYKLANQEIDGFPVTIVGYNTMDIRSDLKKDLLSFEVNSKKTVFLVSIKKEVKISDIENLGAKFHSYINYEKKKEYFVNSDTLNDKIKNFVGYFLHGLKLKSYEFNIYKSKKNKKIVFVNVIGNKNKISVQDHLRFKAIEEGSFFARDLVSEPGNILHPDEYAKRINTLKKFGLKINI